MTSRIRRSGQSFAAASNALARFGLPPVSSSAALGPAEISGSRSIPVLLSKFADTPSDPISATRLQQQLFGTWPTGTMTDYYREISYGKFTVTGSVFAWQTMARQSSYYQGPDTATPEGTTEPCHGVCPQAHLGEYLISSFESLGPTFNWGQYDNDGPDGVPNSGDDDGVVDFAALVHPGRGGECGAPQGSVNRNIWSHRWALSSWTGSPFTTRSPRNGGGFIQIDDYVVMPALACDNATMIQIGVFAHEFGHAFGLPDLYDTDRDNGRSSGLGNWCLMASGSWGGDNKSPERPTHMSPWAKAYLGWAEIRNVPVMQSPPLTLPPSEQSPVIYKLPIAANRYYLLSNISRTGFNSRLPESGLAVWQIDPTIIEQGLPNNRVNADAQHKGVDLIEADGRNGLDSEQYRGGRGDLFPGSAGQRRFDSATIPRNLANKGVCNITVNGVNVVFDYLRNRPSCAGFSPSATMTESAAAAPAVEPADLLPDHLDLQKWVGKSIELKGMLTNLGSNYQKTRDRHIVFQDAAGKTMDVKIALPLEAPGKPGLSSILGKKVQVKGTIRQSPTGTAVFDIETAKPSNNQ
jgi:M6 family metalloprotease-like protein